MFWHHLFHSTLGSQSVYIIPCSHPAIFFSVVSYTFVDPLLNSLIHVPIHGHLHHTFYFIAPTSSDARNTLMSVIHAIYFAEFEWVLLLAHRLQVQPNYFQLMTPPTVSVLFGPTTHQYMGSSDFWTFLFHWVSNYIRTGVFFATSTITNKIRLLKNAYWPFQPASPLHIYTRVMTFSIGKGWHSCSLVAALYRSQLSIFVTEFLLNGNKIEIMQI